MTGRSTHEETIREVMQRGQCDPLREAVAHIQAELAALRAERDDLKEAWEGEPAVQGCEGGPRGFTTDGLRYVVRTLSAQHKNEHELRSNAEEERDEWERCLLLARAEACGHDVGDKSLTHLRKGHSPEPGDHAIAIGVVLREASLQYDEANAKVGKLNSERDTFTEKMLAAELRTQAADARAAKLEAAGRELLHRHDVLMGDTDPSDPDDPDVVAMQQMSAALEGGGEVETWWRVTTAGLKPQWFESVDYAEEDLQRRHPDAGWRIELVRVIPGSKEGGDAD